MDRTVGFVGGGRIARILLGGLKRCGKLPQQVIVSDISPEPLERLKALVPEVKTIVNGNKEASAADIVFLALRPPAIPSAINEVKPALRSEAILISLAPKITMARLKEMLGGFERIVRMLPNACSIVNAGYNPVCFSSAIPDEERKELLEWLGALGDCPEVAEEKIEAYAILTGMGPTYFWFQWVELLELGKSLGLTEREAIDGLKKMLIGAAKTLFESEFSPEEVMDLIPAKPFAEEEQQIRAMYRQKLEAMFQQLKP
jgi:pyrroline-5-carboxylate reductase